MWGQVLRKVLDRLIVVGRLTVIWPDGRQSQHGGKGAEARQAPDVTIRLQDDRTVRDLVTQPLLALGETYMDGTLTVEDDRLYDFLTLLARNRNRGRLPGWLRATEAARKALRRILQKNDAFRSKRNVAHHYDISDDLYRRFLDEDMQYSCAYFADPGMTLEDAQAAKKAHIAAKLRLEPGMRVLDIGCGWGGMALTLAQDYGVHVTGVTLSENQLATAQARARATRLSDRVDFRLMDYRKLDARFDRIVSVGMLEHVGLPHYGEYFDKVGTLLAEDGIALIHTIGRSAPPHQTNPWIARYIFPGGYVPSLSDLAPALEASGMWMADIEVLRGHYGRTLNHWRQRFDAAADAIRAEYDERFIRMFRYYLTACEMAFEEQHQVVFQFQLSRAQHSVPATRDYLYRDRQAMLRAAE